MAFLQRWLDEPDEKIARFAAVFYVLAFVFLAIFGLQVGALMVRGDEPLQAGDVAGPLVSLALLSLMFSMALDGRRSHKARKTQGKTSEPESTPYG